MRAVERRLRERVKKLEMELSVVKEDREKYRRYWTRKLKWFIELHGRNETASMAYLIEDLSKFFNSVESWWWTS